MSSEATTLNRPRAQSIRRRSWPTPNSVPRASAPSTHTTGAAPFFASTNSRYLLAAFPVSLSIADGNAVSQAGTSGVEVMAMTGLPIGQRVVVWTRMPVRFSSSSRRTVAAVRSALGNDPGRTSTTASLRFRLWANNEAPPQGRSTQGRRP